MIKRMWLVLALLLGVLGMFSAVPAGADIPTDIVDQYWTWNRGAPGAPNFWIEEINLINTQEPVWMDNASGKKTVLWLDNIEIPNQVKNIWVEVKFGLPQLEVREMVVEVLKQGVWTSYDPWKTWIGSEGSGATASQFTTCLFKLDWQPAWEYIRFDNEDYYNLNRIELVEVATQCVPEPMSIMLGALGLGAVGGLRKLRRK